MPAGRSARGTRVRVAPVKLTSSLPARVAAAVALVALLHAAAIPILDSDRAAWRYDHGHLSLASGLIEHHHPWDEAYAQDEAERDLVFTFADASVAPEGGVDVPASGAPLAPSHPSRPIVALVVQPLDGPAAAMTPPPRA
jgi:hypothetical protein